jgi:hypothetical protein
LPFARGVLEDLRKMFYYYDYVDVKYLLYLYNGKLISNHLDLS